LPCASPTRLQSRSCARKYQASCRSPTEHEQAHHTCSNRCQLCAVVFQLVSAHKNSVVGCVCLQETNLDLALECKQLHWSKLPVLRLSEVAVILLEY
jgi:hypothetical protein